MATPRRIMKPMPLKGLRSSWPADSIGPEYSPRAINVRFNFGEVRNAPGRGLFDGSPINEPVIKIDNFSLSTDIIWVIMMTRTHLYRRGNVNPGDVLSWFPITGAPSLGGPRRWSTAVGEDQFFFCKGNTNIMHWDGVGADPYELIESVAGFQGIGGGTAGISAFALEYFNNRLMAANTVEGGIEKANRIRWAQSADYRKWDETLGLGAGFMDLNSEGSEAILNIKALGNNLVVYRKQSISEIIPTGTLTPTFIENVKARGIGIFAPYTLATSGQQHFFIGIDKNVWMWDGSSLSPIGTPIQEELKGLVYNDAVLQYFGYCVHSRYEYWLIICDTGRQTFDVFVYDYLRGYWTRDSFSNLYSIGEVEVPLQAYIWLTIPGIWDDWGGYTWNDLKATRVTSIIGGRTDGGTMRIDDQFVSDYYTLGSIIDRVVETEDMYLDTPWDLAQVIRLLLNYEFVNDEPFEVGVSFDRGRTWYTNQVTPVQQGYSFTEFAKTGNVVRFRFRENNATGQFRWRTYGFEIDSQSDFIGTTTA